MIKRLLRYFGFALAIAAAVAVIVALFGQITQGQLVVNHIFVANYIIGGVIAFLGISSVAERGNLAYIRQHQQTPDFQDFQTHRALKDRKANEDAQNGTKLIFIGFSIVAITALAQYAAGFIIT